MKQSRYRSGTVKVIVAAAASALVALGALAPTIAAGDGATTQAAATSPTVYIRGGSEGNLRFVAPKTVVAGEELDIVNETDAHRVGPHTFSLVTKSSVPKTPKARQLCFTKDHICKAIATWHGVKGNGAPKINPADAGLPGWSTMGSLTEKGDSWFTGSKPNSSFSQPVSVDVSAGPQRIYFLCAIHPWMHGSIEVLPGG